MRPDISQPATAKEHYALDQGLHEEAFARGAGKVKPKTLQSWQSHWRFNLGKQHDIVHQLTFVARNLLLLWSIMPSMLVCSLYAAYLLLFL